MFTRTSPAASRPDGPITTRSRLRRATIAGLVAGAAAIVAIAPQATAQPATLKIDGKIKTQLASCAAPAGLCFDGTVKGDLKGTIHGDINSLAPTQQPGVQLVDVTTTIHTKKGDLHFAHEQVVYNTTPDGDGEFSWLMEITGGTGIYAGATGYMQGAGNAPPATGVSTSPYVGEITLG